ncbi:presequence protease 2, chloroplastic/mitochondrial-like isoform X2 [Vigna radiata var. radiata]|nr:presequence protease 2, chloroplastic/mitochondrial-like isoform X2 [Vigna radiata var. radiata]
MMLVISLMGVHTLFPNILAIHGCGIGDPNLLKTLDVYDGTGDFLRKLQIDDDALTKAIIGTIGDVDAYQLPDAKVAVLTRGRKTKKT